MRLPRDLSGAQLIKGLRNLGYVPSIWQGLGHRQKPAKQGPVVPYCLDSASGTANELKDMEWIVDGHIPGYQRGGATLLADMGAVPGLVAIWHGPSGQNLRCQGREVNHARSPGPPSTTSQRANAWTPAVYPVASA